MAKEDFGILEPLVVFCDGEMDFVGEALNLLEEVGGLFKITGGILSHAQLGHFVDQLGIDETLLARLGLKSPGFKGINAVLVRDFVIKSRGASRERGHCEQNEDSQRNPSTHEEPPLKRHHPNFRDYKGIRWAYARKIYVNISSSHAIVTISASFWHCHQYRVFCSSKKRRESRFLFEQNETLAGLPFLIWELSGGCFQEVVVVSDGRRTFVQ
jgi:hypothetical protein